MSIGEFCTREVAIVARDETALDASKVMRELHTGDVVVVEKKGKQNIPVGIITDRDIAIEIVAREVDPSSVTAADLISRELVTINENASVQDAVKAMRDQGIRRLPVINNEGSLEGIFALDDLLEFLSEQLHEMMSTISREAREEEQHRP